jgi:hypothetical protein
MHSNIADFNINGNTPAYYGVDARSLACEMILFKEGRQAVSSATFMMKAR